MNTKNPIIYLMLAVLVHLACALNAMAAPVRGQIQHDDPSSFRILSLQPNGRASVRSISESGNFRLNTRRGSTLHLLNSNGRYFGPVVYPGKTNARPKLTGKKGRLGTVRVGEGFGSTQRSRKRQTLFGRKRISFNKSLGTSGSGKLGLVDTGTLSNQLLPAEEGESRLGDDSDDDGIPNAFDVDDNGDFILDGVDQNAFTFSGIRPTIFTDLPADISETLNVNLGGITDTEIDTFVGDNLSVVMLVINENDEVQSVDVDCSNLSYCNSTTGTAEINGPEMLNGHPIGDLWRTFDSNSDGFPNLANYEEQSKFEIGIFPHANTSQIISGDTFIYKIETSNGVRRVPITLPYYFITTPAMKTYNDGSGDVNVLYPIGAADPGSTGNPYVLTSRQLTVTFWRPQRPAIEGAESGDYIDMGGLQYGFGISANSEVYRCAAADYSNLSSGLEFLTNGSDTTKTDVVVRDTAVDAAPNAANTLSMTLDIDACLTREGVNPAGLTILLSVDARDNDQNNAKQQTHFVLP